MSGRRRWTGVLGVLFLTVPVLEIYLIVQLGQTVGAGWTVLLLLASAVLGVWLVRREGARTWRALQEALAAGRVPGRELADGALVLIGGTLLLTPGFVTDAVGLLAVLPGTRALARGALTRGISRRLVMVPPPGMRGPADASDPGPGSSRSRGPDPGRHQDVVEGVVVDEPTAGEEGRD